MKQKFLVCLTLMLLVLALCGGALAEAAIPEVNVVLSEKRFNGPGPVDVTITVTNASAVDMPGPCALYNPDRARIVDFGTPTLAAGQSATWNGTWQVSQEQLTEGKLTFYLAYHITGEDGVVIQKQQPYSVGIVDAGAEAKLEVTRSITPTTARNGQKVYVLYTITNTGNAPAENVTIQESSAVASDKASLGTVQPGETITHTFTVTMKKKSISSHATVTYKSGTENQNVKVEEATIKYGDVKLTATLAADKKGGMAGDVVKLTLTLKNTGKNDIGNITVTDPVLGTVFTGETAPAGETVTLEKELTITGTADLIFTVTGSTESGSEIQTATEYVHLIAVDPAKEVTLTVVAEADRSTIYTKPGIVKFTVHVTNTSATAATGVTVTASGVKVYPYNTSSAGATINPGETLTFVRDVQVDYPGTFRFDAHTTDQLGDTLTFEGNGVVVRYAPPTATPTMAPIATPAVPVTEPVPQHDSLPAEYDQAESALDIGFYALLGLAGVCLALILVGLIGRSIASGKSRDAADTLERVQGNDYAQSVSRRRRHYMPESEADDDDKAADDAPADDKADSDVIDTETLSNNMQESMNELYPEATHTEEADDAPAADAPEADAPVSEPSADPDVPADDASEGTYRRRRRSAQDE
ncbi:MAG: hypothetical protein IJE07_04825 [Clostridia bacterium]|nr:hypothetical protein [Clostridia bacterium]